MNSSHQRDEAYVLYGSPVSYYTVKVRSYLLYIGKVDYRMNGGDGKRLCTPYSQWMYERVLEPMGKADAEQLDELAKWLNRQNIPFETIQPDNSLVFQRSRLWRRDKL